MRASAIICEFNPIHNGHGYILSRAKKAGADCVICIMSGNAVQRGDLAIADKYTRAECAVRAGADLVVELPYPFSAASAEYFAKAGVYIAEELGADTLFFGSECADDQKLTELARLSLSDDFTETMKKYVRGGFGSAEAHRAAFEALCGENTVLSPNDILGISYLRAMISGNFAIKPECVKRAGAGYGDTELTDADYPSSTALRKLIRSGSLPDAGFMPDGIAELLKYAQNDGIFPIDVRKAESFILGYLRVCGKEYLEKIAGCGGGLAGRLQSAANEETSLEALISKSAGKIYTDSRARRGILFALTGVTDKDIDVPPAYTTLLAANQTGCEYLSTIRKTCTLPIISKPADVPHGEPAQRQAALSQKLDALFTLCMPNVEDSGFFIRKSPKIIKKSVD